MNLEEAALPAIRENRGKMLMLEVGACKPIDREGRKAKMSLRFPASFSSLSSRFRST